MSEPTMLSKDMPTNEVRPRRPNPKIRASHPERRQQRKLRKPVKVHPKEGRILLVARRHQRNLLRVKLPRVRPPSPRVKPQRVNPQRVKPPNGKLPKGKLPRVKPQRVKPPRRKPLRGKPPRVPRVKLPREKLPNLLKIQCSSKCPSILFLGMILIAGVTVVKVFF